MRIQLAIRSVFVFLTILCIFKFLRKEKALFIISYFPRIIRKDQVNMYSAEKETQSQIPFCIWMNPFLSKQRNAKGTYLIPTDRLTRTQVFLSGDRRYRRGWGGEGYWLAGGNESDSHLIQRPSRGSSSPKSYKLVF